MSNYHPEKEWKEHINFIAQLYVRDGLSHERIAERLAEKGFITSKWSVKGQLQKWKIKRYKPEEELLIMARCFLFYQQQGKFATFKRFGEPFPSNEIIEYLNRNTSVEATDKALPEHIQVSLTFMTAEDDVQMASNTPDQASVTAARLAATQMPMRRSPEERPSKKRRFTLPSPVNESDSGERTKTGGGDVGEAEPRNKNANNEKTTDQRKKEMKKALSTLETLSQELGVRDERHQKTVKDVEERLTAAMDYEKVSKKSLKEKTDWGPLHWAACSGDVKITEALLKAGASINARGGHGNTPIHIAALKGHFEVLKILLSQDNVEINAIDNMDATALLCAILGSSLSCALLLVRYGADVDAATYAAATTLHFACATEGLDELVTEIAQRTKNVDIQNEDGDTALYVALSNNNEEYATTLIEAGASLNVPNDEGRTPMHEACFKGSSKLLLSMIERNVNLRATGKLGETVLHLLSQRNLCDVARAVIGKPGVDINAHSHNGSTPLMQAARSGQFDMVRMLVSAGADVDAADEDLHTALIIAIDGGHVEMADFLIQNKSPLNPSNRSSERWKAKLEQKRVVEQALAVPARNKRVRKLSSRQPNSHSESLNFPQFTSNSQMQALNDISSSIIQAGLKALAQNGHPISPKASAQSNYASVSQNSFGGGTPFNFHVPAASDSVNDFVDMSDPLDFNLAGSASGGWFSLNQ